MFNKNYEYKQARTFGIFHRVLIFTVLINCSFILVLIREAQKQLNIKHFSKFSKAANPLTPSSA
jgi:hypothetical protein